jgi:hypothetical protein
MSFSLKPRSAAFLPTAVEGETGTDGAGLHQLALQPVEQRVEIPTFLVDDPPLTRESSTCEVSR